MISRNGFFLLRRKLCYLQYLDKYKPGASRKFPYKSRWRGHCSYSTRTILPMGKKRVPENISDTLLFTESLHRSMVALQAFHYQRYRHPSASPLLHLNTYHHSHGAQPARLLPRPDLQLSSSK